MSDTIRTALQAVYEKRAALASTEAILRARREEYEQSVAHLVATQKAQRAEVEAAEVSCKAVVTLHYAETHERKPAAGVEVKLFDTMHYDTARALEWARSVGMALVPESLDTKAFEKIAKATPLPFVRYGEEVRVQIATDLAKALANEAPTAPQAQEPF